MAYATLQNLIDSFGIEELIRLTDRTNKPASTVDTDVVTAALLSAEAIANSYIAARVPTPVAEPVPQTLQDAVCAIARFKLWKDRGSDTVRQAYQDAITWLGAVSTGKAVLGNAGATPTVAPSAGAPQVCAPERIFTRKSLRGG